MTDERYVVVTAVSTFRQRYCIPVSELQKLNIDVDITNDPVQQVVWAEDEVTMQTIKEFSQKHLGETIVDTFIVDEPRVLHMFNRDNDYLADWSQEKKLEWIHDWKDRPVTLGEDGWESKFYDALDRDPRARQSDWVEESNLTSQKMSGDDDVS